MNKIDILHFTLTNSRSGVNQYILNAWNAIDRNKFQFDFVTFSAKLDFEEQLRQGGGHLYYVKNRAEDNIKCFREEIRNIFSISHPDVVHLHTSYWKSFEIEKLAKEYGVPKIIVHAHNSAVFDDSDREIKTERHLKLREILTEDIATEFWACSKIAAEWLYGNRIPAKQIKILKNAIDISRFTFNPTIRNAYRYKLGWDTKYIIGHVGRFSYQKNHTFLIDIFKAALERNDNLRLLLIGIGPLEKDIREKVERYNLNDKIYFAGPREDVNNWMQAMDCFCLPSHFEGLPIVALEAQAAGLPCLLSSNITDEVKILESLYRIDLCKEQWVQELIKERVDLNRQLGSLKVAEAGFDIQRQIKILEFAYENELLNKNKFK